MTDLRKEVSKNLCPYPVIENCSSCPGEGSQKMTFLRNKFSKNLCSYPLENFSTCTEEGGQKMTDLRKEVSKNLCPFQPRKNIPLFRKRGSKND